MSVRNAVIAASCLIAVLLFAAADAMADCGSCGPGDKAEHSHAKAEVAKAGSQTHCPVMGGKIDKAQYVDAEGHRIYLCCPACASKVEANPETYIKKIKARGNKPAVLASAKKAGSACPGGVCALATPAEGKKADSKKAVINTAALAVLKRADVEMVLLDARGPVKRHIPGAKPVAGLPEKKEAAKLIPAKDTLVVTYCGSVRCPLSHRLAAHLGKLGYKNVVEYPEGIAGWMEAGHETVAGEGSGG